MRAWCPHTAVPRSLCQGVDATRPSPGEMQTSVRRTCTSGRWVCVLGSALPCGLGAVHSTQGRGEQGSLLHPCILARDCCLGPLCTGPAPDPWCICKAPACRQWIPRKRRNWTPWLKWLFFWPTTTLHPYTINIWGMALASTAYNVNGTEPCCWEMIYADNHTLALPWILFSVNALAFLLLCQAFFQSQRSVSSMSLSLKNNALVVEGSLVLVWTLLILM